MTPEQQRTAEQRTSLLLARARAQADLDRASVPAHRGMLQQAIATLDEQLAKLQ